MTGEDLFEKVEGAISNLNLDMKNLRGVTVARICETMKAIGAEEPIVLHCIIHQEALCAKSLEICEVMNVVVRSVIISYDRML